MNTTTNVVHPVGVYYTRYMLTAAQPLLTYTNYAQVSQDIPQGYSDTIKFRRWELLNPATTALEEGLTPDGSNMTYNDITASVDWYGDFVTITDVLKIEVAEPSLEQIAAKQGQQMARTLDTLTRDVLAATTTIQYASSATQNSEITSAMVLTTAELKEAELTLLNANAQELRSAIAATPNYDTYGIPACFVGICHTNVAYDLETESDSTSKFIPVHKYPAQIMLLPGEFGSVGKIRLVRTTDGKYLAGVGDSNINVYVTVILAAEAYGTTQISGATARQIIKQLGSAGSADPLDQRATQGWKIPFVAKILNNNFMVGIRSSSSQG